MAIIKVSQGNKKNTVRLHCQMEHYQFIIVIYYVCSNWYYVRYITCVDFRKSTQFNVSLQKQPLEVFYKKTILKLLRFQHKCFSCKHCEIFKNTYFEEHLRTAASFIKKPFSSLKASYTTDSKIFASNLFFINQKLFLYFRRVFRSG